jgi:DNA-binding LacI/PurR family transcriptional regulator
VKQFQKVVVECFIKGQSAVSGIAKVTVRRVAKSAGVSPATVTRVMRGDRYVAAVTRERVTAAARELGYRPNPAASLLMSQLRRSGVRSYRGKIAWLNSSPDPQAMDRMVWLLTIHQGVRQRAEELGYLVEDFWLSDPRLDPRRLTLVLQTRGIMGLILPGSHRHLDHLDWSRFAAATTHAVLPSPIHRVGNDALGGCRMALARLRERGYRRIGLMLHESHDLTSGGVERAAYLLETAALPSAQRIPILMLPRHSAIAPRAMFQDWVCRRQPDAVLCSDEGVLNWTRELGLEVPARLALATLNRHPHLTEWTGIDMREDCIGAAAVDLVVGQLNSGELGFPPFQKEVLIKGTWVEGSTVRPPA